MTGEEAIKKLQDAERGSERLEQIISSINDDVQARTQARMAIYEALDEIRTAALAEGRAQDVCPDCVKKATP